MRGQDLPTSASEFVSPLTSDDPRVIGPFRIRGRLGAGGMGTVYLGHSPDRRPVAVKMIRADMASDRTFRRRFEREVAAMGRVESPFTAPLIAADVDAPLPWLATAYVHGPTLRDSVARNGPLPPASVATLAAGIARALVAIHAAGVIHRDLKPANVLLAVDGPRVIDFGIARAEFHSGTITTGRIVGSPAYMSPEQARSGRVDASSDVFALGSVLAFAATGRNAFGEGNTADVLYRVVREEPDLTGVDGALHALITSCLRKVPAQRPTPREILSGCHHQPSDSAQTTTWLPVPVLAEIDQRLRHPAVSDGPVEPGERPAPDASDEPVQPGERPAPDEPDAPDTPDTPDTRGELGSSGGSGPGERVEPIEPARPARAGRHPLVGLCVLVGTAAATIAVIAVAPVGNRLPGPWDLRGRGSHTETPGPAGVNGPGEPADRDDLSGDVAEAQRDSSTRSGFPGQDAIDHRPPTGPVPATGPVAPPTTPRAETHADDGHRRVEQPGKAGSFWLVTSPSADMAGTHSHLHPADRPSATTGGAPAGGGSPTPSEPGGPTPPPTQPHQGTSVSPPADSTDPGSGTDPDPRERPDSSAPTATGAPTPADPPP
ncbi:serine/threonine-protein kinase [Frankia sp. CcI49]|uniref:serine/threonine-protein kinase n=1 Tax=Frankia sp. CcI49 TaxID=1745382 RepID=UPI0010544EBA|nr:serine/threonine-protein kinase [Frankia sp. CcI49]